MDNVKTGNMIKELRKEKGMTQKDLADLLHITDRAVSKWERGLSAPDISLLEPLSEILGVSIMEIIAGERKVVESFKEAEETVKEVIDISKKEIKLKTKRIKQNIILSFISIFVLITTFNSFVDGDGFGWQCIPAYFSAKEVASAIVEYDKEQIEEHLAYSEHVYADIIDLQQQGIIIEDYEVDFLKVHLDDMFLFLEIEFEVSYNGLTYRFTCPGTYRNGKIEIMNILSGNVWDDAPKWVLDLQDALYSYNPG